MWTKVRAVGPGPGSVSTLPIVHAPVRAVTRLVPVGNGGVLSIEPGGVGGTRSPSRYGVLKENTAPTQLPPNGATGSASCQVPRGRRSAVTVITCPTTLAAVAGVPGWVSEGSPPAGIASCTAYPKGA